MLASTSICMGKSIAFPHGWSLDLKAYIPTVIKTVYPIGSELWPEFR